jgi:isopenicillin N synthase-like dioxygenase
VNVGELLTFLSGGRWRAAPHQVIPAPSPQGAVRPRISVPFFYRPSDERIVSSFVDNHAEPVPVGAWVLSKKRATKSDER